MSTKKEACCGKCGDKCECGTNCKCDEKTAKDGACCAKCGDNCKCGANCTCDKTATKKHECSCGDACKCGDDCKCPPKEKSFVSKIPLVPTLVVLAGAVAVGIYFYRNNNN